MRRERGGRTGAIRVDHPVDELVDPGESAVERGQRGRAFHHDARAAAPLHLAEQPRPQDEIAETLLARDQQPRTVMSRTVSRTVMPCAVVGTGEPVAVPAPARVEPGHLRADARVAQTPLRFREAALQLAGEQQREPEVEVCERVVGRERHGAFRVRERFVVSAEAVVEYAEVHAAARHARARLPRPRRTTVRRSRSRRDRRRSARAGRARSRCPGRLRAPRSPRSPLRRHGAARAAPRRARSARRPGRDARQPSAAAPGPPTRIVRAAFRTIPRFSAAVSSPGAARSAAANASAASSSRRCT